MKERILQAIYDAMDEIKQQLPSGTKLPHEPETVLFGREGVLDSLGLVNLIVAIEQNIEDEFDESITLASERAMSQKKSPFKTVERLGNYIEELLEELNG